MTTRPTPDKRVQYAHFHLITTRWMDNDAYRHVNNAVYYSYFDTAVNHYLIERNALDIDTSPVIGLVVDTRCSYFREIAFPSVVHAGLRIGHQGTSSIRYEIGLFRDDDDLACAQGHFVHVYVDRTTNRPVPLPDDLKRAIAPLRMTEPAAAR
jgi:acyl-CoA thioester hydrolase